ncbi:caspase family protein [Diaminobutyricimonas sp. LJ205]|uniref:caspase family protein n=1 Tax=Diaminobutyricimonas sp. LJ205 TaxID=2683590 RepID=UPI0012F4CA4C|nr:caspase family protein [Diaminobutyricimonas sp. LJ205]
MPKPKPSKIAGRTVEWPELHGVENDLAAVRSMLLQAVHPLDAMSIITLIEPRDTTAANINDQLDRCVGKLEPGDTFILMLDGHGYHTPDVDSDDGDGWDEVFISSTGEPILDDEFAARWAKTPRDVTIIGLVDTCFADTSGNWLDHPAKHLSKPALPVTIRTRDGAPRFFFSASLQEQDAYETDAAGQRRGVLSAALADVWSLTEGSRESYATLFGYAQQLAAYYDRRQTTRARFTGPELSSVVNRPPFSV